MIEAANTSETSEDSHLHIRRHEIFKPRLKTVLNTERQQAIYRPRTLFTRRCERRWTYVQAKQASA